jgi:hypothetical protein
MVISPPHGLILQMCGVLAVCTFAIFHGPEGQSTCAEAQIWPTDSAEGRDRMIGFPPMSRVWDILRRTFAQVVWMPARLRLPKAVIGQRNRTA